MEPQPVPSNRSSSDSTPLSKLLASRTPRRLEESSASSHLDLEKISDDLISEYSLRSSNSPSTPSAPSVKWSSRQSSFPSIFPDMDKRTIGELGRFYDTENEGTRPAPAPPNEKTVTTPRRRSTTYLRRFSGRSAVSTKSAPQQYEASSPPADRLTEDRDRIRTSPAKKIDNLFTQLAELKTEVEIKPPRRGSLKDNKASPPYGSPFKNKILDVNENLPSPSKPEAYDRQEDRKKIFKKRRKHREIKKLRTPGSKAKELLGIGGNIPRERSGGRKLYLNSIFDGAFGGSASNRKILENLEIDEADEPISVIIDESLSSNAPSDVSSVVTADVQDVTGSEEKIVTLNVGGKKYQTTKITLKKHPRFLKGLHSNEFGTHLQESESYFIDRDPVLFVHIMRYLRESAIHQDLKDIMLYKQLEREATYFCLTNMVVKIKALITQLERNADENLVEYQQRLVMFVREDKLDLTWSNWVLNWGYNFVNWVEASNPKNEETVNKLSGRMATLLKNRTESKKDKDWKYYHLVFQKNLSKAQMKVLQRIDTM